MKVFRVRADMDFQTFYSANRDMHYAGREYLHFNCQRQGDKWNPPELYILEPLLPRGDFSGLQGSDPIVIRDSAYQKISHVFESCAEMLPLNFEGERWWVVNVLPCINALNRAESVVPGDPVPPGKRRIDRYTFFDYRLTNYPLFKIPQNTVNQVLLAQGVVHEDYDLKRLCEKHKLTGLSFVELWSNE